MSAERFRRDIREGLYTVLVVLTLFATLYVGVELGIALADLDVVVDPATGLTTVVEAQQ